MRKSTKTKAILLCTAALALTFGAGFIPTLSASAQTTDFTATEGKFYVVDGASIKIDSIGIRYTTVIEKNYYEALKQSYPNAEFHTEFYDALTDSLMIDQVYTKGIKYYENSALNMSNTEKNVDGYQYHVAVTGFDTADMYGFEMYAKSYVKLDENTKIYAESNETVRSMTQVAKMAAADNVEGVSNYYQDVYMNDAIGYYETAVAGETLNVANLPSSTEETGALTAYIGSKELTGVTFGENSASFSAETLAQFTLGKEYRLTIKGATKGIWFAPFRCVTKLVTDESFKTDMETYKSDANAYLMLSENVTLDNTQFDKTTTSEAVGGMYQVWGTNNFLNHFYGTLDGNGYKLSIAYEATNCGALLTYLYGTIKNLEYDYCATYQPRLTATTGVDQPRAFFVFAIKGGAKIENCFVNVDVTSINWTSKEQIDDLGSALFQQYFGNEAGGVSIRNNIFAYKVNGKDSPIMSYSVTQNAFFYDSIFLTTAGLTEGCPLVAPKSGGVAIGLSNCYFYPTIKDYLTGANGAYAANSIYDNKGEWTKGTPTETTGTHYDVLTASRYWEISATKIELCDKQLHPRVITAEIDGGTLTVTDDQASAATVYEVYVGAEKVGSFTGNSCDVLQMVKGKLVAGDNTLTVTVKTEDWSAEGSATATYVGLTQENFISRVGVSTADDYMVMLEDVSFTNVRTDENYGYANKKQSAGYLYYYAIEKTNGVLDGRGHKIEVELNAVMDTATEGKDNCWTLGLFHIIDATVKNLAYSIEGDYRYSANKIKGFFAFQTGQSTFENCYFYAKMRAIDAATQTGISDSQAMMFAAAQNAVNANDATGVGSFNNCIFEVKVFDSTEAAYVDGKINTAAFWKLVFNECIFITSASEKAQFTTSTSSQAAFTILATDCLKYATIADFVKGENGFDCNGLIFAGANTNPYAETAIEGTATKWDSFNATGAWKVTADGITLCGQTIYAVTAE